jgi:hypothetical protein
MALSYNLVEGPRYRFAPVLEFVGWSVLDGQVTEFNDSDVFVGVFDADGQNIVNIKVGGRLADYCGGSIYAGWGHSLTDERWYEDVFRVDFRRTF